MLRVESVKEECNALGDVKKQDWMATEVRQQVQTVLYR